MNNNCLPPDYKKRLRGLKTPSLYKTYCVTKSLETS